jgi:hypothetical protein
MLASEIRLVSLWPKVDVGLTANNQTALQKVTCERVGFVDQLGTPHFAGQI